jgi:hypothetical protein
MITNNIDTIQAKITTNQILSHEEVNTWNDYCWNAIGDILFEGKCVTYAEYEKLQQQRQEREQQHQQEQKERENKRQWTSSDYDTLNTLLIQYKQTHDRQLFEIAWDKYLHELTYNLVNKYVVKGLTTQAKQLFLSGSSYYDLRDELYTVLVEAIAKWEPNAPDRNTRDFAAFYVQAAYNHVGGYKTRLKRPQYENVIEIRPVNFNNHQEENMLNQNLKQHFNVESDTNYILMNMYVEEFIKTKLTKEQAMLLGLLVTDRLPISEIAKYMKTARMTVYRKIEAIKSLWQEFEGES